MENQEHMQDFSPSERKEWDGSPTLPSEIEESVRENCSKYALNFADWTQRAETLYSESVASYILNKGREGVDVTEIDEETRKAVNKAVSDKSKAEMANPSEAKSFQSASKFFGDNEEGHEFRQFDTSSYVEGDKNREH